MDGPTQSTAGLIDSNILIDSSRGVVAAALFVQARFNAGELLISVVSGMEMVQGSRNLAELQRVRQLLQNAIIVPLSDDASMRALHLMDQFYLSHGLVIADALIAATALDRGLILYTRTVRHFQMIPGLDVQRPY